MAEILDFRIGDNAANTASSRGLRVESFEDVTFGGNRQTLTEIPYRDGFILSGDTSKKPVKRVVRCFMKNYTNATAAYVFNWLRNGNKVFFSDESAEHSGSLTPQNLYRRYVIYDDMVASRTTYGGLEIKITFICQPYKYIETPSEIEIPYSAGTSADGYTLTNIGNTANAPLVRVGRVSQSGGASWISWGSYASERIEFTDLKYALFIDTELQEVYYEDPANGNASLITSLTKFPSVPGSGSRVIKFGGNVNKLNISMRERML